jgi:endoglucanase
MIKSIEFIFPSCSVVLSLFFFAGGAFADDADVRASSIGYVADRAKHASFVGVTSGTFFVKQEDGTLVMTGELRPVGDVGVADFSEVTEAGRYTIEVDGVGRSIDFPISPEVVAEPFLTAMKGFYAWRSGIDISFKYNGERFEHAAGHRDDAYLDYLGSSGEIRDGTGGWYDAGDYGKYIVNSACAVGELLRAFEDNTAALETVVLPFIPETGGALPDFLDEVKYNLDWMLKMQLDDGRVCHKLTPYDFVGFILPAEDSAKRYFSKWGSAATAGFTATMAQAARIYRPYDDTYADALLEAAELSYAYLTAHPENVPADLSDFANQQYRTTDVDDRIWAAAEMWETTGDGAALEDFEERVQHQAGGKPLLDHNWDWGDLKNLGVYTYLGSERPGRDKSLVEALEAAVLESADDLVDTADNGNEGFGRGYTMYYWGSNGLVARACITLRQAYGLTRDEAYLDACMDQIANLFGRNQYNRSYVTGVGYDPPETPHDRRSGATGHAYPGYLVGGGQTATDYVDEKASYTTNEIAINWQGALVYALATFLPETATEEHPKDDIAAGAAAVDGTCDCRQPGGRRPGGGPSLLALLAGWLFYSHRDIE